MDLQEYSAARSDSLNGAGTLKDLQKKHKEQNVRFGSNESQRECAIEVGAHTRAPKNRPKYKRSDMAMAADYLRKSRSKEGGTEWPYQMDRCRTLR